MNTLEQLKQYSKICIDSADFLSFDEQLLNIAEDATTNPSLIFKVSQKEEYQELISKAVYPYKTSDAADIVDELLIEFGVEIAKKISGRVSCQSNPKFAFDEEAIIKQSEYLISSFEKRGIQREQILIKIPATWEGIQAASVLQSKAIDCNLTLIFSLNQAVACAFSKVKLISPFVGRILDWHHKNKAVDEKDPGLETVNKIYAYLKSKGFETEILAASFRNINQIINLAGCDCITISPTLLCELSSSNIKVERKLHADLDASALIEEEAEYADEKNTQKGSFLLNLCQNEMASSLLLAGIRSFYEDTLKLIGVIQKIQYELNA